MADVDGLEALLDVATAEAAGRELPTVEKIRSRGMQRRRVRRSLSLGLAAVAVLVLLGVGVFLRDRDAGSGDQLAAVGSVAADQPVGSARPDEPEFEAVAPEAGPTREYGGEDADAVYEPATAGVEESTILSAEEIFAIHRDLGNDEQGRLAVPYEGIPTVELVRLTVSAPAAVDSGGNAVPRFDDSLVYIVVYNNVAQIRPADQPGIASGELSRADAITIAPKIDVIAVYDAVTGEPYFSEGRGRFGAWRSTQDGEPVTDIEGG